MKANILFLDIDGVLNRNSTKERIGNYMGIDAELLTRFRGLLERVDADVVLSSSWRLFDEFNKYARSVLPIVDETPVINGVPRGEEIALWLAAHPEVERYAIIDDNRDMLPGQTTFYTQSSRGLVDSDVEAVVSYLNGGEYVEGE